MVMKTFRFQIFGIILIGILFSTIMSQENKELTVGADYAAYLNPEDGSHYVEFYYSLYRNQLGFIGSDTGQARYAGVLVTALLEDTEGNRIDSTSTYFYSQVNSEKEEQESGLRLFDLLSLEVEPGAYRAVISAIDDVSKNTGRIVLEIMVPYLQGGFSSSGIQLAYNIRNVEDHDNQKNGSRLEKQGRLVIPNPTSVYQKGVDDRIAFYFELYGLNDSSGVGGFTVDYSIKDGSGNLIHNYGKIEYEKPGRSAVVSSSLDISSLEHGEYYLVFESEDVADHRRAMAIKRFYFIDPNVKVQAIRDEDIKLMSNIAYYHLGEADKIRLGKLDNNGKRNLLRQFWRSQDDTPMDPSNAVYDEAVRRFAYVQENFSVNTNRDDGWKTDRGRVYITYGPYDDLEEVSMTGKKYPYEKWTYYNLEGRSLFIFVNDFTAGMIDYRLVHSTHPRERYDPRWQSILTSNPGEEDWYDSRDKGGY